MKIKIKTPELNIPEYVVLLKNARLSKRMTLKDVAKKLY